MGLTRISADMLNSTAEFFKTPMVLLHQGATQANVDVGFMFNRANGLVSNVALYWSESTQSFVTAFTSNTGLTNSNVTVSSYANLTTGSQTINGNIVVASSIPSTSTTTGALQVAGGVGIGGNLYVGGNLVVAGTQTFQNTETVTATEYVTTVNATNVYAATVGNIGANMVGTGTYLTSLNASNLSSGTVPLAQLSGITTSQLSGTAGITNGQLANNSITVTAGTGMSGGGTVALGGSVTLTNAGVTAFNTRTGAVTLGSGDVTSALTYTPSQIAQTGNLNSIISFDTRSSNFRPSDRGMGLYADFKQDSTDGLSDGAIGFHGVLTFRPYGLTTDFTGGQAQQIATTDNNNLWHRISTSATTWGSWIKVLDTNNMSSSAVTFASLNASGYANIFIPNGSTTNTSLLTLAGNVYGRGGVSYFDAMQLTNSYSGASNPNKYVRLDYTGQLQIINSAYTTNIFNLTDAGALTVPSVYVNNGIFWSANGNPISTGGGGSISGVTSFSSNSSVIGTYTTSSTNSTSGGLQTLGGVGVAGNLNAGTTSLIAGQHTLLSGAQFAPTAGTFLAGAHTVLNGAGGNYLAHGQYPSGSTINGIGVGFGQWAQAGYPAASGAVYYPIILNPLGGQTVIGSGITSTSTTSGSMVVNGGAGVTGNLYVGGNLVVTGTTTTINNTVIEQTINAATIGNIGANHVGTGTYLTSLNASNLSSGTVPLAQLSGITTSQLSGTAGITNAQLANNSVTVTAGTGMSGGGAVALGGSVTLNNAGVTSAVAGTDITVSGATGAVTIGTNSTLATVTGRGATTSSGITLSGGGTSLSLSNATNNRITWGTNGVAPPSYTTYSNGVKLVLYDNIGASLAGYTLGIDSNTMFFTVDSSSSGYKWYAGTSQTMGLGGTGVLTAYNNIVPSANVSYTLGSSTAWWSSIYGTAVHAQYADLAEKYTTDSTYEPGTVVVFGGLEEVTTTTQDHDPRVAGVISTDPAYVMNAMSDGQPVAMTGRVPCLVQGPVTKGQVLVTSKTPGVAQAIDNSKFIPGCVLGKALESINNINIETIEVVVGRF